MTTPLPLVAETQADGAVTLGLALTARMLFVREETAKGHDQGIWGEVLRLFEVVSLQQVQINGLLADRVKELEDRATAEDEATALAADQARITEQQAADQAALDAIIAAQKAMTG